MAKRTWVKVLSFLLAVALMGAVNVISAMAKEGVTSGITDDGFMYEISDGEARIVRYMGSDVDVIIPSEIEDCPVTSIGGGGAFGGCTFIESIVIPQGIVRIGDSAFEGCSGLKSILLPSGLTSIESCTFRGCTSLENIIIPHAVTEIGAQAFAYCTSFTEVLIPEGVNCIGYCAFEGCKALADISIPLTVKSIDSTAFDSTAYDNNPENWTEDVLYIDSVLIKAKKTISGNCNIKDGTATVANNAFFQCRELTGVVIPSSVKTVGDFAFYNCTALESVKISEGLSELGDGAFAECSNLKSLTIPGSVTSIGGAFSLCGVIDVIYYGGTSSMWQELTRGVGIMWGQIYFDWEEVSTAPSSSVPAVAILGDADSNDKVNVKDATQVQKAVASLITLNRTQELMADVDTNKIINVRDATAIQKWVAGVKVEYPIGEGAYVIG